MNISLKIHIQAVIFLLPAFLFFSLPVSANVSLVSDTDIASAGYFTLSWDADLPETTVLQQSRNSDFSGIDHEWEVGRIKSFAMSGLENGIYYYRLVDSDNSLLGSVVSIQVEHHSLFRAFFSFLSGLVLFLVFVFTVFSFSKQNKIAHDLKNA